MAARWRQKEIIELLIKNYDKNFTKISSDPFNNGSTVVTVEAIENGFNVTEENGILIWIMARYDLSDEDKFQLAKLLIAKGFDINEKITPSSNIDVCLKYCQSGDTNYGINALHGAAVYGNLKSIKFLVENGIELETKSGK